MTEQNPSPEVIVPPATPQETLAKEVLQESGIYPVGEAIIEEKKNKHMTLKELVDFVRDVAIILAIVLIVRTYIISPFQINGSSMETSYHTNEYILVNKFSYAMIGDWRVGNPQR
jgi:hypothetical protein